MLRVLVLLVTSFLAFPALAFAQAGTAAQSAEPFKVGTFRIGTTQTVGAVLRDRFVIDLVAANTAMEA